MFLFQYFVLHAIFLSIFFLDIFYLFLLKHFQSPKIYAVGDYSYNILIIIFMLYMLHSSLLVLKIFYQFHYALVKPFETPV